MGTREDASRLASALRALGYTVSVGGVAVRLTVAFTYAGIQSSLDVDMTPAQIVVGAYSDPANRLTRGRLSLAATAAWIASRVQARAEHMAAASARAEEQRRADEVRAASYAPRAREHHWSDDYYGSAARGRNSGD